jgi:hypothetical protein
LVVGRLVGWCNNPIPNGETTKPPNYQPTQHDTLNGRYLIHFSRPTEVRVEARQHTLSDWADVEMLLYDTNAYAERSLSLPLDVELEFAAGEGI